MSDQQQLWLLMSQEHSLVPDSSKQLCYQPRTCKIRWRLSMVQASGYLVSRIHRPRNWHERTKAAGKHLKSAPLQ